MKTIITTEEISRLYQQAVWLGLPEGARKDGMSEEERIFRLRKHVSVVLLLLEGHAQISDTPPDPLEEPAPQEEGDGFDDLEDDSWDDGDDEDEDGEDGLLSRAPTIT